MCRHVPRKSTNLQSIIFTACFSAYLTTSAGFMVRFPLCRWSARGRRLDRVLAGLAGADADDLVDRAHEDLAVADASGLGRLGDRGDDLADVVLVHDDLDLHLGDEVHDVGRAP